MPLKAGYDMQPMMVGGKLVFKKPRKLPSAFDTKQVAPMNIDDLNLEALNEDMRANLLSRLVDMSKMQRRGFQGGLPAILGRKGRGGGRFPSR